MKLTEYLSAAGHSATDFAAILGCETSTVTRILKGERSPSVHLAVKIEEATGGQVTPKDFVSDEPAPTQAGAA